MEDNVLTSTTNYLGYQQYVLDGKEVCPCCAREYTNVGEGVLCEECAASENDGDE